MKISINQTIVLFYLSGEIVEPDATIELLDDCLGKVDYIRFSMNDDEDPITVIKLDTMENEHYTPISSFRPILVDLLSRKATIHLLTHTCFEGGFGFGAFYVESAIED